MIHSGEIYRQQHSIIEKIEADLDQALQRAFLRPTDGRFATKVDIPFDLRDSIIKRHTKSYDPEMIWERICNRYRENAGWAVTVCSNKTTVFAIVLSKAENWIKQNE